MLAFAHCWAEAFFFFPRVINFFCFCPLFQKTGCKVFFNYSILPFPVVRFWSIFRKSGWNRIPEVGLHALPIKSRCSNAALIPLLLLLLVKVGRRCLTFLKANSSFCCSCWFLFSTSADNFPAVPTAESFLRLRPTLRITGSSEVRLSLPALRYTCSLFLRLRSKNA